jgi:hypothetical protein
MRTFKTGLVIVMLALTIGLTSTGTAWALLDNLLAKKSQPAPQTQQYPIHDEETFKPVAKSFHRIPFNDPKLEFDLLLPKDWTSEQTAQIESTQGLSQKILRDIARFKSPMMNTSQAMVIIQSIHLEREISAENWLKNYVLANGYALQEKVNAADEKRASVSFISANEDKSAYVYLTVQINGDIAMIARFESPLWLKDPLEFLRKRTIDSFRFILVTEDPVEQQKTFTFIDALKLSYPQSWTLNYPDVKNPHNMSVQFYNTPKEGQIDGLIRFVIVKRDPQTSLKSETEKIRKYFSDFLHIEFKKVVSSGTSPAYNRFLFSRYEIYQVSSPKKDAPDQEVRLAVLGDKEWYIFAFLLTPSENENLYLWACNTRAFDLILKRLR